MKALGKRDDITGRVNNKIKSQKEYTSELFTSRSLFVMIQILLGNSELEQFATTRREQNGSSCSVFLVFGQCTVFLGALSDYRPGPLGQKRDYTSEKTQSTYDQNNVFSHNQLNVCFYSLLYYDYNIFLVFITEDPCGKQLTKLTK